MMMMMMMMMIALTRSLRDAASSLGRLAMSNLLYLVPGVCTTAAGSLLTYIEAGGSYLWLVGMEVILVII